MDKNLVSRKFQTIISQELELHGLSNQYDAEEDLEELNLDTSGFRVLPDTNDTQDMWEDSSNSGGSGTNFNEHDTLPYLKDSLEPQLNNCQLTNPK